MVQTQPGLTHPRAKDSNEKLLIQGLLPGIEPGETCRSLKIACSKIGSIIREAAA
jgi:hypothetical protein